MTINDINERCSRGEVCICDTICLPNGNEYLPDDFIRRYPQGLPGLMYQYDTIADVAFIYDEQARAKHEYNP